MKILNPNWQKSIVLAVIGFIFILGGCGSAFMSPPETIKKWNTYMENNQIDEAFALYAKDARIVDSSVNKSELKGEEIKNQLSKSATEFNKYQTAGKPLPKFEIINEKTSGDTATVFIAYNLPNSGRKRIDFQLIKENAVWKIKEMDGFGFIFQ